MVKAVRTRCIAKSHIVTFFKIRISAVRGSVLLNKILDFFIVVVGNIRADIKVWSCGYCLESFQQML